jgi:O-antigen ligase
VFVVFAAVREQRHARWIIWGYVAGGVTSALIGFLAVSGVPASEPIDATRLSGGIGDPNELAAFLIPVVALAAFGFAAERDLLVRWLLLSAMAVSGLAILFTLSRGGYLALGAMLLIALAAAGSMRPTAFVLVLGISALALGYFTFAASPEARERITHITSEGGAGRTDIWSVAVAAAADRPLVGVGAGNFPSVEPVYGASARLNLPNVEVVVDRPHVVHNTFLEMVVELGLIGGLAFLLLVAALLAPGVRAWRSFERSGEHDMELLSRGLVIGTLGMLVAFFFVSGQAKEQLWLLLGLAIALGSLASAKPPRRPPHAF